MSIFPTYLEVSFSPNVQGHVLPLLVRAQVNDMGCYFYLTGTTCIIVQIGDACRPSIRYRQPACRLWSSFQLLSDSILQWVPLNQSCTRIGHSWMHLIFTCDIYLSMDLLRYPLDSFIELRKQLSLTFLRISVLMCIFIFTNLYQILQLLMQ